MKKWKRIAPLTMAAVLGTMVPITSFGASLSDYDESTQIKLQDNVLEYDELQGLIAVYNPTLRIADDAFQDVMHGMDVTITDLDTNAGELSRLADDMKAAGNMLGYQLYSQAAKGVKGAVKEYKNIRDSAQSRSSTMELRAAEYQLTAGAQQLMILYQTTTAQREMAAKAVELSEAAYQSSLTQKSLNMATDADVLSAKQAMEQAASGLQQADSGLLNIKQSLCMLTGWSYDASPDIRPVPAVSQEQLDAINLDTDMEKALGNNQTLIKQRSTTVKQSRKMTANEKAKKSRSTSESEQRLKIEMERLYNAVQEKKAEADGVAAAFASAEIAKRGADLKYQTGAIGRLEYLQAEMEFLNQKALKESADMALLQAVNDYEWGVKGLAEIK